MFCFSDLDETSKHLKSTYENMLKTQREVDEDFAKFRIAKENRNLRTTQTSLSSWRTKYNLQQPEEKSQNSFLSGEDNKHKATKDFEFRIPTLPVKKLSGRSSGINEEMLKPSGRSSETILSGNASRIYSLEPDQASNQPGPFSSISSVYPPKLMMSDSSILRRNVQDVPENLSFSLSGIETCSSSRLGENHRVSWCGSANSSLGIISSETLEGWLICINTYEFCLYIYLYTVQ